MSTATRDLAVGRRKKEFVEQVGIQFEELELPRMAGRILGWLLICSPPHQRAADLVLAIGGSKGSISASLSLLLRLQLVDRLGVPGERSLFYQIRPGSWADLFEARAAQLTAVRQLAERGLALLDDAPPAARRRLENMRDLHAFFEREWPVLIQRYRSEREARPGEAAAARRRRKP